MAGLFYDETFEARRWIFPSKPDWKMAQEEAEQRVPAWRWVHADGSTSNGPKAPEWKPAGPWNIVRIRCEGTRMKTWINGVPRARSDTYSGVMDADDYNVTLSIDRPTFVNFLNANRTFFFNTQWFFSYRDWDHAPGPWAVQRPHVRYVANPTDLPVRLPTTARAMPNSSSALGSGICAVKMKSALASTGSSPVIGSVKMPMSTPFSVKVIWPPLRVIVPVGLVAAA